MINFVFVLAGNLPDAPAPQIYIEAARRFAETYKKHPSGHEHRLYLVNSNGGYTAQIADIFCGIEYNIITYNGSGWDIGAQQFAAFSMDPSDWMLAGSSWTYFKEDHWLKPFGEATEKYGDGLYGATTSFEHSPHVRGTAYLIRCGLYQRYPHGINSREASLKWESDPSMSLTNWIQSIGLPAFLVTRNETVPLLDSRRPANIFRRGDQSNILIYDKHTDVYDRANLIEKRVWSDMADCSIFPNQRGLTVFQSLKVKTRSFRRRFGL